MNKTIFNKFKNQKGKISKTELDTFFDGLDPVEISEMIGKWKGGFFPTGSGLEILLKDFILFKWHGKYLLNKNNVKAVIFNVLGLKFNIPFCTAVLRKVEFRDKISTSLIYNYLPIIDNFRRVDEKTLMGVMEIKGRANLYFYLIK